MTTIRQALAHRIKPVVRRHSAFVGSVVAVRTLSPHVILSYDDGPEPGGTDEVLRALAERGATATFFVLLSRARLHPGLLSQLLAAGHEVALHGLDHQRLTRLSFPEVKSRTIDGKHELEDLIGVPVRWMRPPYGRQSLSTWRAVRAAGLEPVLWGPTSWDSRNDVTHNQRLEKALSGIRAGDILLGHDGFATAADGADDGPSPVLDRYELAYSLLGGLADLGLQGVSLGSALAEGTLHRAAWFKR